MHEPFAPLRLGIVGLGAFGHFTADLFAAMPAVQIVAITARDEQKRAQGAARYHAQGYATLDALLADPTVECVVLNTPPYLHGREGLAVIRAGKHVFFEKPLTTTLQEADAIIVAAREQQVSITVDYVERFATLHRMLNAIAARSIFGDVTTISFQNIASNDGLDDDHWFWNQEQSGGIFVEHGVHFFDLGAQLARQAVKSVAGFTFDDPNGRQDRVLATVQYENGLQATYYHAFDRPSILQQTQLLVTFARGSARTIGWIPTLLEIEGEVPPERQEELRQILGVPLTTHEVPAPPGVAGGTAGLVTRASVSLTDELEEYRATVRASMADFALSIRDPTHTPMCTPDDAYQSLRTALAARTSAREGNRIIQLATDHLEA